MVGVDLLGNLPEWQERALCAQTDPEAFFPEKGGSTREAKRICNRCEVRTECLEYALGHDERFGIWGGLSERERRRLKRGETVGPKKESPRVAQVRRLATEGLKDFQIASEVGCTPGSVGELRRRHRIPAGKGRGAFVAVAPTKGRTGTWRAPVGSGAT
jgi:WhiB family redox-sensing transcriptional regulator